MAIFQIYEYFGELISAVVILYTLAYLWFQYSFSYWSSKRVRGPAPAFPFGNIRDVITRKSQFFQPYCDNYFKFKHLPYVGMYSFNRPVLCVNDPDVAKHILIKDFDYFQAHGIFSASEGIDPLAAHLFNSHGDRWKNLRVKMSPAFSSGKLKTMYPLVQKTAEEGMKYLDSLESKGNSINISEFYETYTMEIIASVGFGVECNGFKNPNTEFYVRGHEYFEPTSLYWALARALAFFAPDLSRQLKIRRFSPGMIEFFYGLVKDTVEYRQKHAFRRNDFIQTLIELKNGQSVDENGNIKPIDGFPFSLDDVAANTMLYMVAGYETSATVGQFTAYELALNPGVQARARDEVTRVLARHENQCTYEAQNEMTYLNMIFDETMRKYPPMRALFRRCNKEYRLPDSDLLIDEGTLVFVPVQGIQMDPDIFPEPDKFDPDRFLPENKANMHPCHWMPFGAGPRKCLGLRQGYIQVKIALIKILQKYEIVLDERTAVPMRVKPTAMCCAPDGGVWVKLRKLADQ
ncbi:unnamed protein product [Plutella xylostella]|uniref:unspecific monooxygenase n=1 Tax=Plutella xylostella TaxID=51655 RepID=A0A8S4FVS3_PLUXY|nr:unnamed protein product [Plutella xylostella]